MRKLFNFAILAGVVAVAFSLQFGIPKAPAVSIVEAQAADGTEDQGSGVACKSFSVTNAENRKDHPDLQVVKLTESQKAKLETMSAGADFTGVDAYTITYPGSHVAAIVLVKDDCITQAAMVPLQVLVEIVGQDT